MLTNCLAACAHLTITVSEIQRDICEKKSSFYHTPLHSTPQLEGLPSEYRHPVWYGKTRMVSLPDGEKISKISLFVLAQLRNMTDGRTDTGWQQRPRLCVASRGKSRARVLCLWLNASVMMAWNSWVSLICISGQLLINSHRLICL